MKPKTITELINLLEYNYSQLGQPVDIKCINNNEIHIKNLDQEFISLYQDCKYILKNHINYPYSKAKEAISILNEINLSIQNQEMDKELYRSLNITKLNLYIGEHCVFSENI